MARGRKGTAGLTRCEELVVAYIALSPDDQAYVQAMIRGAQLAAKASGITVPITGGSPALSGHDQSRFEELGEPVATEE